MTDSFLDLLHRPDDGSAAFRDVPPASQQPAHVPPGSPDGAWTTTWTLTVTRTPVGGAVAAVGSGPAVRPDHGHWLVEPTPSHGIALGAPPTPHEQVVSRQLQWSLPPAPLAEPVPAGLPQPPAEPVAQASLRARDAPAAPTAPTAPTEAAPRTPQPPPPVFLRCAVLLAVGLALVTATVRADLLEQYGIGCPDNRVVSAYLSELVQRAGAAVGHDRP